MILKIALMVLLEVICTAIIAEAKAKPEASHSYNLPSYESHHGATYYDESINIEGNIYRPNIDSNKNNDYTVIQVSSHEDDLQYYKFHYEKDNDDDSYSVEDDDDEYYKEEKKYHDVQPSTYTKESNYKAPSIHKETSYKLNKEEPSVILYKDQPLFKTEKYNKDEEPSVRYKETPSYKPYEEEPLYKTDNNKYKEEPSYKIYKPEPIYKPDNKDIGEQPQVISLHEPSYKTYKPEPMYKTDYNKYKEEPTYKTYKPEPIYKDKPSYEPDYKSITERPSYIKAPIYKEKPSYKPYKEETDEHKNHLVKYEKEQPASSNPIYYKKEELTYNKEPAALYKESSNYNVKYEESGRSKEHANIHHDSIYRDITKSEIPIVIHTAPANYRSDWAVNDGYYNDFGQKEARVDDKTSGSYWVDLPDGRRQTVKYHVDGKSGFVADVSYDDYAKVTSKITSP